MIVHLTIPGEPVGKGRPKFSSRGGFVKAYTPKATASYENLIKCIYAEKYDHMVFPKGALEIKVIAFKSVPSSASAKKKKMMVNGTIRPTTKPDADNIAKIVCDALNKIAYHDDSQIVDAYIQKGYAEEPCVQIFIREVHQIENTEN